MCGSVRSQILGDIWNGAANLSVGADEVDRGLKHQLERERADVRPVAQVADDQDQQRARRDGAASEDERDDVPAAAADRGDRLDAEQRRQDERREQVGVYGSAQKIPAPNAVHSARVRVEPRYHNATPAIVHGNVTNVV